MGHNGYPDHQHDYKSRLFKTRASRNRIARATRAIAFANAVANAFTATTRYTTRHPAITSTHHRTGRSTRAATTARTSARYTARWPAFASAHNRAGRSAFAAPATIAGTGYSTG